MNPNPLYASDAAAAAARYGIPVAIFDNLIGVESSWQPYKFGADGEVGLTQIKPSTAGDLGLDPYDTTSNLEAGAKYLAQQFATFGNWFDALGAYNAGPTGYKAGGQAQAAGQAYANKILQGIDPATPGLGPEDTPTRGEATTPAKIAASAWQSFLNIFRNDAAGDGDRGTATPIHTPTIASTVDAIIGNSTVKGNPVGDASTAGTDFSMGGVVKYGVGGIVVVASIILGLYIVARESKPLILSQVR